MRPRRKLMWLRASTDSRNGRTQQGGVPKGKPPGGDPAAPVRRRSCRGAGSATAGVSPLIWQLQPFSARVLFPGSTHWVRPPAMATLAAPTAVFSMAVASEPTEHCKTALLVIVQTLVEGICGLGQLAQGDSHVRHGVGASAQALGRIRCGRAAPHRADSVDAQLSKLARRLLKGWPVLLLFGIQRQSGLERGKARLSERAQVLDVG